MKNRKMKIKLVNKSKHTLPEYSKQLSAGIDLRANIDSPINLKPMQRALVPTGLFIGLPQGVEAQVSPGSGLAIKNGITVLNSPGRRGIWTYRGKINYFS